jgi:hypothetical protein
MERFGVGRGYFQTVRRSQKTAEGTDWSRETGDIRWSEAGAALLEAQLGVVSQPPPLDDPPPIKNGATLLLVANPRLSQERLVACVVPGDDPLNRKNWRLVRVRSSRLFLPKMEILAEPLDDSAMWRFLGRPGTPAGAPVRYPRGRGRW